jgi:hypothetical protein
MSRKLFLLIIFIVFFPVLIYAQEELLPDVVTETEESAIIPLSDKPDFWIGVGGDTAFYSASGLSSGGSFMLGYGTGAAIGLKASYFANGKNFNILEMDLLLRFYLFGKDAYSGSFIQLMGGAALINYHDGFDIPSGTGILNAGFCLGWRFLFANRVFLEPIVRLGYPYFMGLGLSAGVRF